MTCSQRRTRARCENSNCWRSLLLPIGNSDNRGTFLLQINRKNNPLVYRLLVYVIDVLFTRIIELKFASGNNCRDKTIAEIRRLRVVCRATKMRWGRCVPPKGEKMFECCPYASSMWEWRDDLRGEWRVLHSGSKWRSLTALYDACMNLDTCTNQRPYECEEIRKKSLEPIHWYIWTSVCRRDGYLRRLPVW